MRLNKRTRATIRDVPLFEVVRYIVYVLFSLSTDSLTCNRTTACTCKVCNAVNTVCSHLPSNYLIVWLALLREWTSDRDHGFFPWIGPGSQYDAVAYIHVRNVSYENTVLPA